MLQVLESHGIDIGHRTERELFIEVYRFLATRHVLNSINWDEFEQDSLFQLVFPQAGMIREDVVRAYTSAKTDEQRERILQIADRCPVHKSLSREIKIRSTLK